MTCPVAGLNPNELLDGTDIVRAINHEVLGNPAYTNLPRKCNIAVTGCRTIASTRRRKTSRWSRPITTWA
jgi:sulfite reductase beta subunit-like hemoprotein